MHFLFVAAFVAVVFFSCTSDIDKKKFDKLNRDADIIQKSTLSEVTYERFGELLQGFSADIRTVGGSLSAKREKDLLKEYSVLLNIYQDGYLLWKFSREFSRHNLVPEGRIYVGQDVEPIVTKYRLSTEAHIFGPTQQSWKSISAESIQIIWYNAGEQIKHINYLLSE